VRLHEVVVHRAPKLLHLSQHVQIFQPFHGGRALAGNGPGGHHASPRVGAAVDANLVAVLHPFVGHGITGDERIGSAL